MQYITDKQVSKRFGVSRPTVWRWAKYSINGFPQPLKLGGSTRWKLSDIENWEAKLGASK